MRGDYTKRYISNHQLRRDAIRLRHSWQANTVALTLRLNRPCLARDRIAQIIRAEFRQAGVCCN